MNSNSTEVHINAKVQTSIADVQEAVVQQIEILEELSRGEMVTIQPHDNPRQAAHDLREAWTILVQQCNVASDSRTLVAALALLNEGAFALTP